MKARKIEAKRVYTVTPNNIMKIIDMIDREALQWDDHKVGRDIVNDVPMCFDTETTKITEIKKMGDVEVETIHSFIYMFQLQFGDITIISRVKDLMMDIFAHINDMYANPFDPKLSKRVFCAIANLKFEWSFLCKDFMELRNRWNMEPNAKIYTGQMQPLTVDLGCITLIDIVKMTNSSLAKIGKDYCFTRKKSGDLDYNKIRNSMTPMTIREMGYCINDVIVGAEFMMYIHENYTSKGKKIPTTATAIPRTMMKEEAYEKQNGSYVYSDMLENVKIGFPAKYSEYEFLMNYLFRGGYTHGNAFHVAEILHNVEHVDYTSDYPACLLQHRYPTTFETDFIIYNKKKINIQKFSCEQGVRALLRHEDDLAFYCKAHFTNLSATTDHSIESDSKCVEISDDAVVDNGRVLKAESMTVMITEQDFEIYSKFYTWKNLEITDLHVGFKTPLPMYVIHAIVTSYVAKKRLKDQGLSYAAEKALLNSVYGCTVQRIIIGDTREIYTPDDVKTINSSVHFDYLVPGNARNEKYFAYIAESLSKKYGYIINDALMNAIRMICDNITNDTHPNTDHPKYWNIYNEIVEQLQQRAYHEEKDGCAVDMNGRSIGRPKILSCWWGVWCTAYARRRLLDMVFDLEEYATANSLDPIVVYCDTDSMFLNCHQSPECWNFVKSRIDAYNTKTESNNISNLTAYDNSGLLNDIGMFTWEPTCLDFKQLGAKRYLQRFRAKVKHKKFKFISKKKGTPHGPRKMVVKSRFIIESTVAGLPKEAFSKRVQKIGGVFGDIESKFDFFTDGMVFEEFESGKLRPVYDVHPYSAIVTDEFGNTEVMTERCGQSLTEVPFNMQLIGALAERVQARKG